MEQKSVAIIGAGASGLMCAVNLCDNPKFNITIFDKNEIVGKKILITGNGRCNVTNLCEPNQFLNNVCVNSKFLTSAINNFSSYDMVEFLNANKVKTSVEQNNRVFPNTNKAASITNAFKSILDNASNVSFKLGVKVSGINKINNLFEVCYNNTIKTFDYVVIATGGLSYPITGSQGDGFNFARSLGVNVTKLRAGLCGIKIKENLKTLVGVSFNVKLSYKVYNSTGAIMITNYGISGPATLNLSSKILDYSVNGEKLIIDFLPDISVLDLTEKFKQYKIKNAKKQISTVLSGFVNQKLAEIILAKCEIELKKQISQITKEELNSIVDALKFFELTCLGFDDIEHATITRGGVDVKEINPKTFECKTINNLYFIGEVLDVDALSGGFNLQIAFSTGYACAKAIANKI